LNFLSSERKNHRRKISGKKINFANNFSTENVPATKQLNEPSDDGSMNTNTSFITKIPSKNTIPDLFIPIPAMILIDDMFIFSFGSLKLGIRMNKNETINKQFVQSLCSKSVGSLLQSYITYRANCQVHIAFVCA
jgi:hypothetical protein